MQYNGREAVISRSITPHKVKAQINYSLSPEQEQLSAKLLTNSEDIYISAVCGAGKTEIVFASIEQALSQGRRVGFIIPRREVVREIAARLRKVYPTLIVNEVYGGHAQILDGEIVVLTTHQAYRYPAKFGLIIVDEYDAFPFKGDRVLHVFVKRACYGKCIFLSATFTASELLGQKRLELNKRYHNHPLPVPIYKRTWNKTMLWHVIQEVRRLLKKQTCVFVYLPYVDDTQRYYRYLRFFFRPIACYNSTIANKVQLFNEIRHGRYRVVVCTTILERGITIRDLDVVVAYADNPIFDKATLIQIAGRVGRIASRSNGQVILLAQQQNHDIKECIRHLDEINTHVSFMP